MSSQINDKKYSEIYCNLCNRETKHEILFSMAKEYITDEENTFYTEECIYDILMCCGCEIVSFRESWNFDKLVNPKTGERVYDERIYPSRNRDKLRVVEYTNVPYNLNIIYREIINCYNGKNYILCTAGIRALIEGICRDKKVDNGPVELTDANGNPYNKRTNNIEGKINGMVEKGFLTKEHAETLHELRFIGNEALHELEIPSVDELKNAIQVIEHTFENQYELSRKKEVFRRRKIKK